MENHLDTHWIIVAVVVVTLSLAVAPVYWMRPSPRQRQLARLRQYALSLALRPELRDVPPPLQQLSGEQKLMLYQWHRPDEDWPRDGDKWLALGPDFTWLTSSGYQPGSDQLLEELRMGVPEGLYAVEAGPAGVGVYWHESGSEDRVDSLQRILVTWAAAYRSSYTTKG